MGVFIYYVIHLVSLSDIEETKTCCMTGGIFAKGFVVGFSYPPK